MMKIRLSIVVVLIVMVSVLSHVNAAPEHCSTHSIKDFAVDACSHIVGRKFKRQIDLSDFGYNIESVTARHHHRHPRAKKLTHKDFPNGAYLLIHYPLAQHVYSSNNNQINEDSSSREMTNEILETNWPENIPTSSPRRQNLKNKYSMKIKRSAHPDAGGPVDYCCEGKDTCGQVFCN